MNDHMNDANDAAQRILDGLNNHRTVTADMDLDYPDAGWGEHVSADDVRLVVAALQTYREAERTARRTPPVPWWVCPNALCEHGAVLHDVYDMEDRTPRCCVDDCPCGSTLTPEP